MVDGNPRVILSRMSSTESPCFKSTLTSGVPRAVPSRRPPWQPAHFASYAERNGSTERDGSAGPVKSSCQSKAIAIARVARAADRMVAVRRITSPLPLRDGAHRTNDSRIRYLSRGLRSPSGNPICGGIHLGHGGTLAPSSTEQEYHSLKSLSRIVQFSSALSTVPNTSKSRGASEVDRKASDTDSHSRGRATERTAQ